MLKMKKKFILMMMCFCLLSLPLKAGFDISESDMMASQVAKEMLQNEAYFEHLDETQKAAVCTGAISSYQGCLAGEKAGEQFLEASKILFGEVYGNLSEYEGYIKGGAVYGFLLAKQAQKCDVVGAFTNNNCQEMMLKNAQYIQEHLSGQ